MAQASPAVGGTVAITAGPGAILEGSPSGNNPFVFTIAKDTALGNTTVTYTLTGTATPGEDYTALSGTINLTNTQPSKNITVNVKKDTKFELDETLILTLTGVTGPYVVGPPTCAPGCEVGTILNDDTQPTVKLGWNNTLESAGSAVVTVTLSNKSYQPVFVDAFTTDGTAVAPGDYTATSFLASNTALYGVNSGSNANGLLYLNPSTGAIVGGQVITVPTRTIFSAKGLSIDPTTGTAYAVVLSDVGRLLVTLNLATGAGVEIGSLGPNFTSIVFNSAGQLFGNTGSVGGGALFAIDKTNAATTFIVQLANGSFGQAMAYRGTDNSIYHFSGDGTVTLQKVLAAPPYTVTPIASVGASEVFGAVWLPSSDQFLLTHYSNSAVDFWSPSGVVSNPQPSAGGKVRGMALAGAFLVPPDNLTATLAVPIVQDNIDEENETFTVSLANPSGATLGSPFTQTKQITDDDAPVTVSISGDQTVVEGNSGTQSVIFTATLSAASERIVKVVTSTTPGTATSPSDYLSTPVPNVLTFNPGGPLFQTFAVTVKGDGVLEPDETFSVNVVPNLNVTAGSPVTAQVTIQNDDSPAMSINDPVITEGNAGTSIMNFTVSITSPAPPGGVGFTYQTSDLTATAGSDYVAAGPTVVTGTSGGILAGNTSTTIPITINGDTTVEGHEQFMVTISAPTGNSATILDGQGTGTIQNDDGVAAGSLVISEFRLNGPGGTTDEFVEVTNTTAAPIGVGEIGDTSAAGGFSVAQNGNVKLFRIPNGTVIPARGHYLAANAGYTLGAYGGGATPDAIWVGGDAADDTGLALFATANTGNYSSGTRLDSVGFTSDSGSLFVEPASCGACGLTGVGTGAGSVQYSFVRRYPVGAGSTLQDLEDSAGDFALVATDANATLSNAVLGAPGPENLAAEQEFTNTDLTMTAPDGNFSIVSPNVVEFYRLFTNNTGAAVNSLRFKVSAITGVPDVPTKADLRPVASGTVVISNTYNGLNLEDGPVGYSVLTGGQLSGGLNTTLRPIGGVPVGIGGSIGVNFRVGYTIGGGFYYWLVPEGK